MARRKMTEGQKALSAAARLNPMQAAKMAIKHLSFQELDQLMDLINKQKRRSVGDEQSRLQKRKEVIEQQLELLKNMGN